MQLDYGRSIVLESFLKTDKYVRSVLHLKGKPYNRKAVSKLSVKTGQNCKEE